MTSPELMLIILNAKLISLPPLGIRRRAMNPATAVTELIQSRVHTYLADVQGARAREG